jgi:hypothetical protein
LPHGHRDAEVGQDVRLPLVEVQKERPERSEHGLPRSQRRLFGGDGLVEDALGGQRRVGRGDLVLEDTDQRGQRERLPVEGDRGGRREMLLDARDHRAVAVTTCGFGDLGHRFLLSWWS